MYRRLVALPALFFMLMFAYVDRVNISFAMGSIEASLGVTSTISGLISGVFFVGYIILQTPGGYWASSKGVRKCMLISGVLTGVFASSQGFVTNTTTFIILRFFLGLAEGVMFPAGIVFLSKWFSEKERGRASNIFLSYSAIGPLIMSPICGWLITNLHWRGVESWRLMLIIEGLAPFIWAIVFYFIVSDDPQDSKYISQKEKDELAESLRIEKLKPKIISSSDSLLQAALNKDFLVYAISWFAMVVGNYGITIWLPEIIKQLSNAGLQEVGLIASLPWFFTFAAMLATGYINDMWGNKKMLLFILVSVAGVALLVSAFIGSVNPWLAIGAITIAMMAAFSAPPTYVSGLPLFVSPEKFGTLSGLAATICNLGGFFGPLCVGKAITMSGGNKLVGLFFLSACYIASGLLILFVNLNKKAKN